MRTFRNLSMMAASTLALQLLLPVAATAADESNAAPQPAAAAQDDKNALSPGDREHDNPPGGTSSTGTMGGATENKDHLDGKYAPKRSSDGIVRLPGGQPAENTPTADGGRFAPGRNAPAPTKTPPVSNGGKN